MLNLRISIFLSWLFISSLFAIDPPKLNVGDKAPTLSADLFLQGHPVTTFEKGRFYVVEFWATWCVPCVKAIPHLNELQSRYANRVTFLGIAAAEMGSSNEEKIGKLRDFIAGFEGGVQYPMAFDGNGTMRRDWTEAAGVSVIPISFVVDSDGILAFQGHPTQLEKVLPQILDGTFDRAKHCNDLSEQRKRMDEIKASSSALKHAEQQGDLEGQVRILDTLVQLQPGVYWLLKRMTILAGPLHRPEEAYGPVEKFLSEKFPSDRPAADAFDLFCLLCALHNEEDPLAHPNPTLSERAGVLLENLIPKLRVEHPEYFHQAALGLASRYMSLGRFGEARALLDEAVARCSKEQTRTIGRLQEKLLLVTQAERKVGGEKKSHDPVAVDTDLVCDGDACMLVQKKDCPGIVSNGGS
jgi:thiol-disulfide isomerase/thioredoxin